MRNLPMTMCGTIREEEKQMHRITVTLKCGKEIRWDTVEDEPMKSVMNSEAGYLYVKDGRDIHIAKSEVAAVEAIPLVKCRHCGQYTLPDRVVHKTLAGDAYHSNVCHECGAQV